MKYLLLYGKTTAKKPLWYCEKHCCGITEKCCRKRCWVCSHLKPMSRSRAAEISGKGRT
nr:MAG TPA: Insulin-degrading enzyme [Caudoviricetes sp.]